MLAQGLIAALLATSVQAAQPAATITAPARTVTVSEETLAHWTQFAGGPAGAARQGQALELLIGAAWTEGEAAERGITVGDAEVREEAVPDEDRSRADELFLARVELLAARIRDQITQPAALSVTPEQIEAYVQANPRLDPEQRSARVLQARSRAHAKRALAAIRRGLTWSGAAKRYGSGGSRRTLDKGTELSRDERAIFRAAKGELTRYGTTVFRVTKISPARPAAPDVQRAQAWEILSSERQQQALAAFEQAFNDKWRARTTCAPAFAGHESCGKPPTGE